VRVLGAAAGGGYPQWNCACRLCQRVRSGGSGARARAHACLAISCTQKNWYLVNATPDIRYQIESFHHLHAGPGLRETPIRGILLTDAEFDHTIGLLILREGAPIEVYAAPAIITALTDTFPVRRLLEPYAKLSWNELPAEKPFQLDEGRLQVQTLALGKKRPRYVVQFENQSDWVVGYRFADLQTGGTVVYAPAIERWSDEFGREVSRADLALLDGTFWSNDEMVRLRASKLTATEMGHIPISGPEGSATRFRAFKTKRKVYTHINNTNPILDESSAENRWLADNGIEVGWDGMEAEV
jgi:pyrroloquinoline quinone biosynthesis protein B